MFQSIGDIIGKKYGMLVVVKGERLLNDRMVETSTELLDNKIQCYAPKCELARLKGSLWCSTHINIEVFSQLDDKLDTDKLRNN